MTREERHAVGGTEAAESDVLAFVRNHLPILLPGLYLLGSTVGMLDSWWFFRHFGIDIFLFSDLSDYLLASFREPAAWFIVAFSILVAVWDHVVSLRSARSSRVPRWLRWYGSRRYRRTSWTIAIGLIGAYILIFAGARADRVFEGTYGSQAEIVFADGSQAEAVVLGGTIGFLFLYDRAQGAARVHPYDSVMSVRLMPQRSAAEVTAAESTAAEGKPAEATATGGKPAEAAATESIVPGRYTQ